MSEQKSVYLKVAEAMANDIGRGIARIGGKAREELSISTGDVVKLMGKKAALAIAWPAHPDDEDEDAVRIDGILRQNSGVGLGDKVKLSKVEAKEAKKLILAPQQPVRFHAGFDQYVKKKLVGKPLIKGNVLPIGVFGTPLPLVVFSTLPSGPVMISENTDVEVKAEPMKELGKVASITYDDVGGLEEEMKKIREMVELPLRHPELFERLGIEPPKGVLLYGPPGTGKTLLAKAVANESDVNFFYIGGPEVVSKYVGESEQRIRQLFDEAQKNSPSIIFIDELDAIAPKREEVAGEVERRMVSQLLTLMDGLKSRGQVIVIAATNRPDSIDPALRRPGRFDREIELGVPDAKGREAILQIHTRNMPLDKNVDVKELAALTHGYTGADLSSLTKEAAIHALRRIRDKIDIEEDIPIEVLDQLIVKRTDFSEAMRGITPSALREVFVEKPNVHWDDVGGLTSVKSELKELVELPIKRPEVFERMGIRPIRGVLMYGPPGTGKTMLAKAVATETEANFISINGPEIFSKWVGESEKITREFFRKARMAAPCILFIDEIDAIAPARTAGGENGTLVSERVVDTILSEMDGLKAMKKVIVIAATNRPDMLDTALLRAGRFDRIVEIPLPDDAAREEIFRVYVKSPLEETGLEDAIKEYTKVFLRRPLKGVTPKEIAAMIKAHYDVWENVYKNAEGIAKEKKKTAGKDEFRIAIKNIDVPNLEIDIEGICRKAEDLAKKRGRSAAGKDEFNEALSSVKTPYFDADVVNICKKAQDIAEKNNRNEIGKEDFAGAIEETRLDTKKMPILGVSIKNIAATTKGYSGADIENLCREAGMMAIRKNKKIVGDKEFEEALRKISPRLVKQDVDSMKKFKSEFSEMYR